MCTTCDPYKVITVLSSETKKRIGESWALLEEEVVAASSDLLRGTVRFFGPPRAKTSNRGFTYYVRNMGLVISPRVTYLIRMYDRDLFKILPTHEGVLITPKSGQVVEVEGARKLNLSFTMDAFAAMYVDPVSIRIVE